MGKTSDAGKTYPAGACELPTGSWRKLSAVEQTALTEGGGLGRVFSKHSGANRTAADLKTDATGFEQVGNGGDRFAAVATVAAHGEDEVAEGVVAVCDFEWLFHGWRGWVG